MNITTLALNLRVMVRRVATGAAPYSWEVLREGTATPLQVSAERFKGMEAAYKAGEAWLKDYISRLPAPRRTRAAEQCDILDASFAPARRQRNDALQQEMLATLSPDEADDEDSFDEEMESADLLVLEPQAD